MLAKCKLNGSWQHFALGLLYFTSILLQSAVSSHSACIHSRRLRTRLAYALFGFAFSSHSAGPPVTANASHMQAYVAKVCCRLAQSANRVQTVEPAMQSVCKLQSLCCKPYASQRGSIASHMPTVVLLCKQSLHGSHFALGSHNSAILGFDLAYAKSAPRFLLDCANSQARHKITKL